VGNVIGFVLYNFPSVCLVLAFFLAVVIRTRKSFGERLTRYLLLLPVGITGLWGFYYHAFYPEFAAQMIGWATSPFQFEVAVANLGIGLAGIIGIWRSRDFALATIIVVSCLFWGAAFGHIRLIIEQADFAPGNAGSMLYTDILIPFSLWLGYFLWRKGKVKA